MIIEINLFTGAILFLPFLIYLILRRNKMTTRERIIKTIFFAYILLLLKYAIFPIYLKTDIADTIRSQSTLKEIIGTNVNLIPFFSGFNLRDFVLNIIMTLPFGFFLGVLRKDLDIKKIFKIALALGLGLELCQFILIFIQGFTFRNININDSIANCIGVLIGFGIYKSISEKLFIKNK